MQDIAKSDRARVEWPSAGRTIAMKRLVVVIAIGVLGGALGALACGGGSDKPPLTPDQTSMDDGGAGAASSGGGGATGADGG